MGLGLLYLGLTLLGTLHIQAKYIPPALIPEPPLCKIPLHPNFQDDQFQGKWFGIGIAGNAIWKGKGSSYEYSMYSDTYELEDDQSYNVTTIIYRDDECIQQNLKFVPYVKPGQFSLDNKTQGMTIAIHTTVSDGLDIYTISVTTTDYNQFAMMYAVVKFENMVYFQARLYGRTKELNSRVKKHFIRFSKSLGLSDDNIIFFEPIGNYQLHRGVGKWRWTLSNMMLPHTREVEE
ncbi:neutrophil gelatinase-associated lipocalin-like [Octodon degus]|uniref:Neutrophil gelatinase-associated lipocalin-like n=1 Tax=Octodon degus TaxID=10160 RepID=A0A6P3VCW5_OCTDE|nr:neutrophil gelatinase-associated lipocalin-like [Octodon degus]